jgi:hypothetical protein
MPKPEHILQRAAEWDGHKPEDVTRLISLTKKEGETE